MPFDDGGQQFGEDAGLRTGDRKVGEERGMVPVRDAGNDLLREIGEQRVVRTAAVGRGGGELLFDVAGLHAREDVVLLDAVEIVRGPVNETMAGSAEFVRVRIELRHARHLLRRRANSQERARPRR
jgi:hypothetical protein